MAVIATGLAVGALMSLGAPAALAGAAEPPPVGGAPFAVAVQFGLTGIVFTSTYPDMTTCEFVPTANCFHFTDGTVIGQVAPMKFLFQILGVVASGQGNCTPIVNIRSGVSTVDEIYVNFPEPLVVGPGSCADLLSDIANHSIQLVVPFCSEKITPSVVSVEDLSVALARRATG